MDSHGGKTKSVPRGGAPAGGPTDRGSTEGCVDTHPEVVPPHRLVMEASHAFLTIHLVSAVRSEVSSKTHTLYL